MSHMPYTAEEAGWLTAVSCHEVAELLRAAVAGRVPFEPDDLTWDQIYCGIYVCRIGGADIAFFNDCDELDYVDRIQMRDGRRAEPFAEADGGWPNFLRPFGWPAESLWWDPVAILTDEECAALVALFNRPNSSSTEQ